jgi:hypothetical protein
MSVVREVVDETLERIQVEVNNALAMRANAREGRQFPDVWCEIRHKAPYKYFVLIRGEGPQVSLFVKGFLHARGLEFVEVR